MARIVFIVLSFTASFFTLAQSFDYWDSQFGVRAVYLGGSSGSVHDNTAIYYNPASIAFVENSNLSVTANSFSLKRTKIENALGDDLTLKGTKLSVFPQFLAGLIKLKKTNKIKIGYVLLARHAFNNENTVNYSNQFELIDSIAGKEDYFASYQLDHRIVELWGGVGMSYLVNEHFSIGFTFFISYRDERYLNNLSIRIAPTNQLSFSFASMVSRTDISYFNFKGIFKPSIAVNYPRFRLGFSATLPSFSAYGEAKVSRELSLVNLPSLPQNDFLFTDSQRKIRTKHRYPGSISLGIGGKISKNAWLHFTSEYFFPLKPYYIYNADGQTNVIPNVISEEEVKNIFGGYNFLSYGERRKGVLNVGLGYEQGINEHIELLFGFRTNFNYSYDEDRYYEIERMKMVGATWDTYFFSFGVGIFGKKQKRISIGAEFGFAGSSSVVQYLNLTNPELESFLTGDRQSAKLQQYTFRLMFGIELNIKKPKKSPSEE